MARARRKRNITLRLEQGEPIPRAGESVRMRSLFGPTSYDIHITRIHRKIPHEDGATLLTVDASVKQVLSEAQGEPTKSHALPAK